MKGIVIKSTGSRYNVRDEDGNIHICRIKGRLRMDGFKATNPVVVGDKVVFETEPAESSELLGVISAIEPRKNYIIRKSTNLSKQVHIIASNIDMAFLVVTVAYPRTTFGFIDRFLITAEAYSIPVSILFNKCDLYNTEEQNLLNKYKSLYEGAGYPCYEVSAFTGFGLENLRQLLKEKVSLFSGHSGVGKSSLVNKIDPSLHLRVGTISDTHEKGTHTTTFAEIHELKSGGFIVDTPGIKEFGLVAIEKNELSHFFPEMRALFNCCKFNSCLHINEPKCAVREAVETGKIAATRYNTYLNIISGEELLKEYEK